MILDAVVTVVNGSRFFDLYVPQLGIEARIQVLEVLPAIEALWNPQARCSPTLGRASQSVVLTTVLEHQSGTLYATERLLQSGYFQG